MEVPDELEMLQALPVIANHVETEDGVFLYDFQDASQTLLRLSFSIIARSIQTDLYVANRLLVSVCQEGAIFLRLRQDKEGNSILLGEFGITLHPAQASARAKLEVQFYPQILVNWSTLWDIDYGQLN